jgi:hypothetical protein
MLQGYGTLGYGVETTGEIKAHTHTYVREFGALAQFAGGSQASGVTTNTGSTGGTHNLAAGKGVAIYIKF